MTNGKENIGKYFDGVATRKTYTGYMYNIRNIIVMTIVGSVCGLVDLKKIQMWASNLKVKVMLRKDFGIKHVPSYSHYTKLLGLIKPDSLDDHFRKWADTIRPSNNEGLTIAFDGKTIRSTGKMDGYWSALHIVSAHISELGITIGQSTVDEKSNEIPAMQALVNLLQLEGALIVADALNCQKETAKAVLDNGADYLLSVKDNQPTLKGEIEEKIMSQKDSLETVSSLDERSDRTEKRTAYVCTDIAPMKSVSERMGVSCVGAIENKVTVKGVTTSEWHFYISSRALSAENLLKSARLEWGVESMHWLLDVHFREDYCRVLDENAQQNLNMIRKIALNKLQLFKAKTKSKLPISNIMFQGLLDFDRIIEIFNC